jgi:hypothetical protein
MLTISGNVILFVLFIRSVYHTLLVCRYQTALENALRQEVPLTLAYIQQQYGVKQLLPPTNFPNLDY